MNDNDRIRHLERLAHDGYTIVNNAIEPSLVDALNAALERLERELDAKPAMNGFEGHHTVRIYNLLAHGKPFDRVPLHENVLPLFEGVLDPGCLISSLSSIAIDPGETAHTRGRGAPTLGSSVGDARPTRSERRSAPPAAGRSQRTQTTT